MKQLRRWIPFESACFTTVDPRTLLSTGAITDEDIEAIHDRLFEYEYLRAITITFMNWRTPWRRWLR